MVRDLTSFSVLWSVCDDGSSPVILSDEEVTLSPSCIPLALHFLFVLGFLTTLVSILSLISEISLTHAASFLRSLLD